MATVRSSKAKSSRPARGKTPLAPGFKPQAEPRELVILTGMSGSGKLSALKAFEDLGFYSVDNLPLELIPRFADLVAKSAEITHAALVVDVREGSRLERAFRDMYTGTQHVFIGEKTYTDAAQIHLGLIEDQFGL